MLNTSIMAAVSDIIATLRQYSLVGMLGWQDVSHRYKRSSLGAFWLTISMGIMIGTMSVVFSKIFQLPLREFLPFLSIGMILWGFISSVVTEGCQGFVAAQSIIKQLDLPLFVHIARLLWRNAIVLGHNLVIFPIVILTVGKPPTWIILLCIPGFILLIANLAWITLLIAIVCTRYRDMTPIINSVLQIVFYLTPIMWMPNKLSHRAGTYLIDANPVYHLISIVRSPLLGTLPTQLNWIVAIALALCGWALTLIIYSRYQRRIAYWL